MNKKILIVLLIVLFALAFFLLLRTVKPENTGNKPVESSAQPGQIQTGMANPASVYCEQQGGKLNIVTDAQGGQSGVCVFTNGVQCDEWKFFRGECSRYIPVDGVVVDIKADTELIKLALVEKDGIKLSEVNVVVSEDTGKYASGGITPKEPGVGGGYFFAAKTDTGWKIVASGNGSIMCEWLKPYPDLPSSMISECVDASGSPIQR